MRTLIETILGHMKSLTCSHKLSAMALLCLDSFGIGNGHIGNFFIWIATMPASVALVADLGQQYNDSLVLSTSIILALDIRRLVTMPIDEVVEFRYSRV
jgi:hypothetical protein